MLIDFGLCNDFLNMSVQAQATRPKIGKQYCINIKPSAQERKH